MKVEPERPMEEEDRLLALCTQSWRNIQKYCKGVDFIGRDLELRIWQSDPSIDQAWDPG